MNLRALLVTIVFLAATVLSRGGMGGGGRGGGGARGGGFSSGSRGGSSSSSAGRSSGSSSSFGGSRAAGGASGFTNRGGGVSSGSYHATSPAARSSFNSGFGTYLAASMMTSMAFHMAFNSAGHRYYVIQQPHEPFKSQEMSYYWGEEMLPKCGPSTQTSSSSSTSSPPPTSSSTSPSSSSPSTSSTNDDDNTVFTGLVGEFGDGWNETENEPKSALANTTTAQLDEQKGKTVPGMYKDKNGACKVQLVCVSTIGVNNQSGEQPSGSEEDVLQSMQFQNGSKPTQLAWLCPGEGHECCDLGCCEESGMDNGIPSARLVSTFSSYQNPMNSAHSLYREKVYVRPPSAAHTGQLPEKRMPSNLS